MRLRPGTYALFLSVILWGTLLGGIAYSHIVYFPVYLSALPASSVVVNGTYGLNEATFWLTIHPLLLISLIITLALNWKNRRRLKLIGNSQTPAETPTWIPPFGSRKPSRIALANADEAIRYHVGRSARPSRPAARSSPHAISRIRISE